MDSSKEKSIGRYLLELVIAVLVYSGVATLAWNYFAPMVNMPILSFWEITLLRLGIGTIFSKPKISER